MIVLLLFAGSAGATAKYLSSDDGRSYDIDDYDTDRRINLGLPYVPREHEWLPQYERDEDRSPRRRNNVSSGVGRRSYVFDRETGQLRYEEED